MTQLSKPRFRSERMTVLQFHRAPLRKTRVSAAMARPETFARTARTMVFSGSEPPVVLPFGSPGQPSPGRLYAPREGTFTRNLFGVMAMGLLPVDLMSWKRRKTSNFTPIVSSILYSYHAWLIR
jgi:hypothetical protein